MQFASSETLSYNPGSAASLAVDMLYSGQIEQSLVCVSGFNGSPKVIGLSFSRWDRPTS